MNKEKEILILNIDDVLPNRFQPRIKFNEKNILELADSIREHGVIQPIVVRKISDKYEIIAGERRYKASILAGKTTIPAILTNFDDKESAEVALLENVQRQDLTPIEEAISYKKILDMGYINQTDLAEKLGKTQSTVANKLRLLNLSEEVQEALLEGKISERHARSLLKLNNEQQVQLLSRIINERMTVRKTDEEIKKILENKIPEKIDKVEKESINEKNESENLEEDFEIVDIGENELEGNINMNQNNNVFNPFMNNNVQPANNSLMNDNVVDLGISESENNSSDTETGGNKFFNVSNNNDTNYVNDLESKEVNMNFGNPNADLTSAFNFNAVDPSSFNQPQSTANPMSENPFMNNQVTNQPVEEVVQPTANPMSQNPFMNNQVTNQPVEEVVQPTTNPMNQNPFMNNQVTNQPVEEVVQPTANPMNQNPFMNNQVTSQPVEEVVQPTTNPINQNPFMNNQVTNQPVEEVVQPTTNPMSQNPFMNSQVTNQPVEEVVQPTANPMNQNPFMNNQETSQPVEEVVQPIATPMSQNPFMNNQQSEQDLMNNQLKPYTLDDDEEFVNRSTVEMASSNPSYNNEYRINQEPPVIVPNNTHTNIKQADLKTVINTIRNCANTIEKYGYIIDTEEIDFEDSYQVIFKIEK